jgi:hypothetical protein
MVTIKAIWDSEAKVWVAQNDELGLSTEAETLEQLTEKLEVMIPELLELNQGVVSDPLPINLQAERTLMLTHG